MSNNLYSNLHKLYPVQKTLRFELKPVGKTVENIEKNEILKTDEEKLGLAKLLKKEMDEFYKIKIDEILETLFLEGLERYYEELSDKEKSEENTTYLKQQIINKFNEKIKFIKNNKLDKDEIEDKGKESIIKILTSESLFTLMKDYYKSDVDKLNLINEFKGYSVYFSGFWKNRNFMFGGSKVEDAKKGSIPYRLIDENLPLFIQNINVYNNILIKGNEELKSKINSILTENNFFDNINKFNSALTQKSIEKYNLLITGYSKKDGTKVQGLNEIANLYNQEHHLRGAEKIPAFTILFKQILSEKSTESFVIDIIENDEEVFSIIDDFIDNIEFNTILFDEISNKEQVYILNKLNITQLSKDLLGNWNEITNKLYEWYFNNINNKNSSKKYEENRKKYFNKIKEYNIKFIETIANKDLLEHFKKTNQSLIDNINKYKNEYKNLPKVSIDNLKKDNKSIEAIKDLLDSIKALQDFLYQFNIVNPSLEKDIAFYDEFNKYYTNLKEIIPIYNKIRNYISKKAFLTDKIKLNFNNASLMTGWSRSKEYEKSGIMLKKYNEKRNEYDYFVGIINIDNRGDLKGNEDYSPFDVFINNEAKENFYEKMELNLFPGASKMLPKCFVSAKQYQETLDKTFLDNYKAGKHTKSNLDKDYLCDYINYMKQKLAENYSHFNFEFSNTENYNSIDEFYKEVDEQGYHVSFSKIEESKINELIENNNLYLFQIWSKDFSEYSKGLPNNQTIYLQQLFSKENLENTTIKLSGNSEVFFRKKSIPYEETHKANEELKNKNEKNNKKTSKFNYPLIKDKRYTENKFSFHFPIVINFKNEKYSPKDLNTLINTNIDSFNHIIGIDRGERNLVYVVIIDKNGQIQEQISLNEII
ncbi:MAG: type V CRISPR-associated protein Cas12a/Cpf1, partial [Firmicutes bacterium]|nr:type V CRISPR-associated protein Cas12a/Cpf1 [Bacillota bacterium]